MVKVLIVDDQVLIRAGMAAILRAAPGYEVVGEACNGAEAVTMAALTEPDVVLMDIRMPDMDGIAATRAILGSGAEKLPHILILTTFDMDEYVYEALRAGADGFVLKDTPPERLLAALKAVADGDTLFSSAVTRRLVQAYVKATGLDVEPAGPGPGAGGIPGGAADWPPAGLIPRSRRSEGPSSAERAALAALTTRETDVLRLVATGLSNGEIAERLVVSEGTVKTHLNRAMAKLHLSSRAQAVVLAYESGLVVAGQPQPQA
ncbi:response regulator [Catenulispora pinisilvae]|uniref:response regulator n=1 Tax=Catenulispora pinisilvae TaxID=2705253 RepID=UPI001891405E|nr:response regulator transcription factor [Catenulispora pinisilvae]